MLPAFDEVSAKALAKIPDARYSTARAFGDGIRRAFASAHDSQLSRRVSHETIVAFTAPRREPEPQRRGCAAAHDTGEAELYSGVTVASGCSASGSSCASGPASAAGPSVDSRTSFRSSGAGPAHSDS